MSEKKTLNFGKPLPIGAWCLCERIKAPSKTLGGLEIPDSARKTPDRARIISVGRGYRDSKTGKIFLPPDIVVGAVVYLGREGGTDIEFAGKILTFVHFDQILAVEQDASTMPIEFTFGDLDYLESITSMCDACNTFVNSHLMPFTKDLIKRAGKAFKAWQNNSGK